MAETTSQLAARFDARRQIEEMHGEARRILLDVEQGKTEKDIELAEARLQSLIRKYAEQITKSVYVSPDHMLAMMTIAAMLTTAWVSFVMRKESVYVSKAYEDRLTLTDVLDALDVAINEIIETGRRTG
jgi:hypothetical protein